MIHKKDTSHHISAQHHPASAGISRHPHFSDQTYLFLVSCILFPVFRNLLFGQVFNNHREIRFETDGIGNTEYRSHPGFLHAEFFEGELGTGCTREASLTETGVNAPAGRSCTIPDGQVPYNVEGDCAGVRQRKGKPACLKGKLSMMVLCLFGGV